MRDEAENHKQDTSNNDVHRWPSKRDPEFVTGIFGVPLQSRDTAYGQQRGVLCADTVAFRGQSVSELMQQHAHKERDDESHATPCFPPAVTLTKMREQNPPEEQDKRPMHVNADSANEPSFSDHFIMRSISNCESPEDLRHIL